MNKTNLWIVLIVTAVWIGFMTGYAVSSHSGCAKSDAAAPASQGTGAGGYGK